MSLIARVVDTWSMSITTKQARHLKLDDVCDFEGETGVVTGVRYFAMRSKVLVLWQDEARTSTFRADEEVPMAELEVRQ